MMFMALIIVVSRKKSWVVFCLKAVVNTCIYLSARPLLGSYYLISRLRSIGLDHIKLAIMTGFQCESLEFILSLEDQHFVFYALTSWNSLHNSFVTLRQFKSMLTNHLTSVCTCFNGFVFHFVSFISFLLVCFYLVSLRIIYT